MNCTKTKQWLLLAESGELSARRRAKMESHRAGCASCQGYRELLLRLRVDTRACAPVPPLDRVTRAVILDAAEHHARRRAEAAAPGWTFLSALRLPVSAYAALAVLAFALGFGLMWGHRPAAPAVGDARGLSAVPLLAFDDLVDVELDLLSDELSGAALDSDEMATLESSPLDDADDAAEELLEIYGVKA